MHSEGVNWRARIGGIICLTLLATVLFQAEPSEAQVPSRQIGVNTEFKFPTKDTPPEADVDSAALVENASLWDKRTIRFTGEAIGEQMVRGEMAWIHLNDDPYMQKPFEENRSLAGYNSGHAVWVSAELARQIAVFGDYRHVGDVVQVTGVFNAACREHGGDMDIHASALTILRPGHAVQDRFNIPRALLATSLLGLAAILYGYRRSGLRRRI